MNNKQQIRKALKAIENLVEQADHGMAMDNAMDGSGDCGGAIASGWVKWFNRQLVKVLNENGVTLSEVMAITDDWAKRELENGPKHIFISMYGRRHGMYKEVDYFDTKWGGIAVTIHNFTHANDY